MPVDQPTIMKPQKRFFKAELLDVEAAVANNNLKEITNPIFFTSNNAPTPDGLLSNEIFGITKEDRSEIFAYISFGKEWFLNPLVYKIWSRMDSKVVDCIYGNGTYRIDEKGKLVSDPDGGTGLDFLKANFDKVKFDRNNSIVRSANIEFLDKYKDRIFINKFIIIPAFYRDVNTTDRYVGVGDINKLYNSLLIAAKSLKEYDEYGLMIQDSIKGRMQNIMLQIYEYFTSTLSGKLGLIRYAASSKTSDYSSRLIIVAPNLKVENMDDMLCDVDHAAVPLASILANFFPYMVVYLRNFFANEFQNRGLFEVWNEKEKKMIKLQPIDYRIQFSDEVLNEELDRFIHGFSDRFRRVMVKVEPNPYNVTEIPVRFVGYYTPPEKYEDNATVPVNDNMKIQERDLTWCDLFFMGAVEVSHDKTVLVTRYPIDSCYNQFPLLINVSSTMQTEPMVVNNKLYKHYPKIDQEDIGINTSNKFIDTLGISNIYLESIGGDY